MQALVIMTREVCWAIHSHPCYYSHFVDKSTDICRVTVLFHYSGSLENSLQMHNGKKPVDLCSEIQTEHSKDCPSLFPNSWVSPGWLKGCGLGSSETFFTPTSGIWCWQSAGSLHPPPRGLSMWLLCEDFYTAWWLGFPRRRSPGREDLVRAVSSSQPTPRSHTTSLPAHRIPRGRPKVFPRFERREWWDSTRARGTRNAAEAILEQYNLPPGPSRSHLSSRWKSLGREPSSYLPCAELQRFHLSNRTNKIFHSWRL